MTGTVSTTDTTVTTGTTIIYIADSISTTVCQYMHHYNIAGLVERSSYSYSGARSESDSGASRASYIVVRL